MNKNDSVSSLMNEEYSYKEDNLNIDISKAKISYAAQKGNIMKTDMKSILRLDKVVFDKIEFDRLGFKNDTELKLEIQTNIGERKDKAAYKVTVIAIGKKPDEYKFHISITGYFTFRTEDIETDLKNELISKNSVAILMPYLRSEISLLTAQPETETVVLPVFNINRMMDE